MNMEKDKTDKGNPGRPEGESGKKMLERMNREHAPLRDFGLPYADWTSGMHILDVGCGGGATIAQMLKLSDGSIIDGIDYAQQSVDSASALNREYLGSRVHIHLGDVAALPFRDASYDLATAVETVYFWPDMSAALAEIKRVLKPDGMFMILCEGSDPDTNTWSQDYGAMTIYRPEELASLLKNAGFADVSFKRGPGEYICVMGKKAHGGIYAGN